jgi:hypothetical protein
MEGERLREKREKGEMEREIYKNYIRYLL